MRWKSLWGTEAVAEPEGRGDEPNGTRAPCDAVHWSSRWGFGGIDGRADFIPAAGGCVLHLNLRGTGPMGKLLLASPALLDRNARCRWRLMNPGPAISTFSHTSAESSAATIACATSRGIVPSCLPRLIATFAW